LGITNLVNGYVKLSQLSKLEIDSLIEYNIIEYELRLAEFIPGAGIHQKSHLTWMMRGLPFDTYNACK